MTEMFGEAWPPMSVPDLAHDDDDDDDDYGNHVGRLDLDNKRINKTAERMYLRLESICLSWQILYKSS